MTKPLLEKTISGNFLRIFDAGVLILGSTGSGKSDISLELIARGHALIADDSVILQQTNKHAVVGSCPSAGKGFLFVYDIGLVDIAATFGDEAVAEKHKLDMIIQLTADEKKSSLEPYEMAPLLASLFPRFVLSKTTYRPTAVLIETMTRCFLLDKKGHNALARFRKKQRQIMDHPNL